MSPELQERREQATQKIAHLLKEIDPTLQKLYELRLLQDDDKGLNEEQLVARLEGFHDYIVVREATGLQHPSLANFLEIRKETPEKLISFGTGKHRKLLEGEDEPIDDTVNDEELAQMEAAILEPEIETPEQETEVSVENDESHVEETKEPEVPVVNTEDKETHNIFAGGEEVIISGDEESPLAETSTEVKEEASSVPGRLDAQAVSEKEFSEKRGGYNKDQVDDMLDEVVVFLSKPRNVEECEKMKETLESLKLKSSALRSGFNSHEVDGYVSAIIAEIQNRITEQ